MALTTVDGGMLSATNAQYTMFKNRLINGAMVIDQRNAGASVTQTTAALYTVDRWLINGAVTSKFTGQQNAGSVTPPAGFTKYLGITSLSSYAILTTDYYLVQQNIEGFNVADLGWGTSSAATVTLSFWVRSSLTGTFGGSIRNYTATRSYPFSFAINSANTWEQKSITIAGDTAGTWPTDNGGSLVLAFSMGTGATYSGTAGTWAGTNYASATGAVSVVGTNGATFYITGVQLEKGSTATAFDYRPYGTELQLCQRYFEVIGSVSGGGNYATFGFGTGTLTTIASCIVNWMVPKRTVPTFSYNTLANFCAFSSTWGSPLAATAINALYIGSNSALVQVTVASGLTAGSPSAIGANNNTNAQLYFSAEL